MYLFKAMPQNITPVYSLEEWKNTPHENGVLLSVFHIHNPYNSTTNKETDLFVFPKACFSFDFFLKLWKPQAENTNRLLMLDIQTKQIEADCLELLAKYDITHYVFVNSAFPDIFECRGQYAAAAKFAYRISEYEGIENLLRNPELYDWLFIDSLTGRFLLTPDLYDWALRREIQICVVSPLIHLLPYDPAFFNELDQYVHIHLVSPYYTVTDTE